MSKHHCGEVGCIHCYKAMNKKHNLSAFEENILRAFNDAHFNKRDPTFPDFESRKIDNIPEMAPRTFSLLVARGQMPDQLRVDYIEKVLYHFKEIGVIY